ncbi:MAG: FAD-binding protein [Lachnospiraceae bacterium]|nr:FAD-binding protein [Lachnospiraceae bacterium]
MLRITQCKFPITYTDDDLRIFAAKKLRIAEAQIESVSLIRRSLDARKKPALFYVITMDVALCGGRKTEEEVLSRLENTAQKKRGKNAAGRQHEKGNKKTGPAGSFDILFAPEPYRFPETDRETVSEKGRETETTGFGENRKSPLVVGSGPAGLACAYYLAKAGLSPILIERGKPVRERRKDVERFWATGMLDPASNVQFGEGGAGTFSDGKLNTLIKDKDGRCREILRLFVEMGAPSDILYDHKPHVGTDLLMGMTENLRNEILRMGGQVLFETALVDIQQENGRVTGAVVEVRETGKSGDDGKTIQGENGLAEVSPVDDSQGKHKIQIDTDTIVLAIGHSARDTFQMLSDRQLSMEAKAFAVGFRILHPQSMIDLSQYGEQPPEILKRLGAAAYKLTAQTSVGRGVYSFCMCPGGYVVNASSEEGLLAVNGMSYHGRASGTANSALIVSVTPADYPGGGADPLSGVAFQRDLERKTYLLAGGKIPVQSYGAYKQGIEEQTLESEVVMSDGLAVKGLWKAADLSGLLPADCRQAFLEGMQQFGRKIHGFDQDDVLLAGIESRTSSPLRILRDESGQSLSLRGLYPVGEGAGYAGGIMSAAMDGLLAAERIVKSQLS